MKKLTLKQLESFLCRKENYCLSDFQKERVKQSFEFLKTFSKDKVIYGINTGFGPMSQYKISDRQVGELQYNLIRSHATGMGDPLEPVTVKAVMISRLNTLCLGFSGVSLNVVNTLQAFIDNKIYPFIPKHGGVGASGDLVQLAHLGLALIGEGSVFYRGNEMAASAAIKKAGIKPAKLQLRDGLAIINGTSCMSGIAVLNLIHSERVIHWAIQTASVMNELTASYDDSFSKDLNASKLHVGQQKVAELMRHCVKDGKVLKKRNDHLFNGDRIKGKEYFSEKVQEYYSLRCVPQIIGPVWDTWQQAKKIVEAEINSANDNPIICAESQNVYHGGNFHGDYIAFEMDKLKIGIAKLSMLIERQINYLLNSKLNDKFPPFLNKLKSGFNFGLQGLQFTAVSTTAENQTLSNPMYVHSIPNNGDNQDIVSMGTNAALMTQKVIDNSFEVLTIQMISIAQAMDLSDNFDQFSSAAKELYKFVREEVAVIEQDRPLSDDLTRLKNKVLITKKELL